ncbi:MAG: cytochrome o ubiquinol oxidase subunit IV [Pseudomonadota bacterium]
MSGEHKPGAGQDADIPHATLKGYMTGFLLSAVLTAIPFWLVLGDVLDSKTAIIGLILGLGAVQIVVHVIYFLHMDAKAEAGWKLMSFLFTGTLLLIILSGSMWIMYHLHENTHPQPSATETRNMP